MDRRLLLVLLHALSTAHALRIVPARPVCRRTLLAGLVAAAAPTAALAVSAGQAEAATAADLAQVLKSYTTLGTSLDEWTSETTLMQIGRPTQLQRAVDQLPEETLKRLSAEKGLQARACTLVVTGPRRTHAHRSVARVPALSRERALAAGEHHGAAQGAPEQPDIPLPRERRDQVRVAGGRTKVHGRRQEGGRVREGAGARRASCPCGHACPTRTRTANITPLLTASSPLPHRFLTASSPLPHRPSPHHRFLTAPRRRWPPLARCWESTWRPCPRRARDLGPMHQGPK